MKLLSSRLRGAIGIYDGLGVDEVNVDFTQFEPGLICIYGNTGSGKTTFVENLVPFRKLFTRSGGLANHFRLKDSCRDLWVEIGPDQYQFLLNINADSGKIESYVSRNGICLNPDGKEDSYNQEIAKLVGSQELYKASVFQAQERSRFSELPPERREELFNLEAIQAKSKYSGDKAKALESEISELTGRIAQLEATIAELADVDQSIEIGKKLVADREQSIAKIEARIAELQNQLVRLEEQARGQVALKTELESIDKAIQQLQLDKTNIGYEHKKKLEQIEAAIGVTKGEISGQERLLDPEKLQRMRELITKRAELAAEIEAHVAAHGTHVAAKTELSTASSDLNSTVYKLTSEMEKARDAWTIAKAASNLIYDVPCQKIADAEELKRCSECQFLTDAIAAEKSLSSLESDYRAKDKQLQDQKSVLESKLKSAQENLAANPFDEVRAKACKAELAAIDAQKPAEYIQRAEVAETKLAALREKLTGLEAQHKTIQDEETAKVAAVVNSIEAQVVQRSAIASKIDSTIDSSIATVKESITSAQRDEKLDRDQLTAAKKDIEALLLKLEQRGEAEGRLSVCRESLMALQSDQADWTHLSQMLSRNGFQSYLIETLAVTMTEFSNELLKKYGRPWTIEILTSVPTVDGKSQKSGFFIFINTPTDRREIGLLSGGQKVWIETIMQHAVANALQQRSGHILQTKITDEADAALDSEGRYAYLEATELAHKESGLHHTLMISHSQEIQNAINQRIHFKRGKGIEIERD